MQSSRQREWLPSTALSDWAVSFPHIVRQAAPVSLNGHCRAHFNLAWGEATVAETSYVRSTGPVRGPETADWYNNLGLLEVINSDPPAALEQAYLRQHESSAIAA
jgi:hypothetical protein